MAKISVIIPAYNAERTILETIASVQAQTFSDFEIIVINDGSTDTTLAQLGTVRDSRLRVCSFENGGLATARNRGIKEATGDYIAFLDADDLWMPQKLECQIEALQSYPEAGVAYSWTTCMREEEGETLFFKGPTAPFTGNVYPQLLLHNFVGSGSCILATRPAIESVGEFDALPKGSEDWDYYLRLAAQWPFTVVPEYHILYRQAAGSMSTNIKLMADGGLTLIDKAFNQAPAQLQHLKPQALSICYRYCADLYLGNRTERSALWEAQRSLLQSVQVWPWALTQSDTQQLIVRCLLRAILPSAMADQVRKYKKRRLDNPIADPRLEDYLRYSVK